MVGGRKQGIAVGGSGDKLQVRPGLAQLESNQRFYWAQESEDSAKLRDSKTGWRAGVREEDW